MKYKKFDKLDKPLAFIVMNKYEKEYEWFLKYLYVNVLK